MDVKSNVITSVLPPLLQALDNVPILLYILALKTLLLCLAFAGVKIYQSKKEEEALKKKQQEKRRLAQKTQELLDNLKEDWELVLLHGEVRYAAFISFIYRYINISIYMMNCKIKDPYFNTVFFFFKETERKWAMSHRDSQTAGNHLKQRLRIVMYTVTIHMFSWWETICLNGATMAGSLYFPPLTFVLCVFIV